MTYRKSSITQKLVQYAGCTNAATVIEYTLIAAGISLAIAGAVYAFGDQVYTLFFEDLPSALDN